ncbi:hypothetical protein SAMN05421595_2349 [Austwickia chelonae]|uniref:Uncharacterized protein n=1 Tax=Austwickia chelonae NBRC 105200 TaxID=1184607 RepID=K6VTN1_9MICO|nr:hypothetical protein [Austwickia chelonae]GAB78695.1 hypothetical protein AUCHE_16_01150 [Austwickia chelonae NBRC 105200]SEW34787.1 hypothetical protein SAMN05421595_2349 [Austwickia chelonae]
MATPQYGAQPPQYGAPPQGQPYPQYGPPQGVPQGQPQYQMPQYGMPQYGMPPQAPYGGYQPPMNMPIPQSMLRGVLLMKVGAILSLISPLLAFVPGSFSNNVLTNMSRLKNTPSSQAVQAFEVSFVIVLLITTAGVFGLWVWMAVMNNKGRSWARIVATVFFGFSVLGTLRIMLIGSPPVDIVVNLVITVIGAASIYFLFQPESSAYYKSRSHALT